MAKKNWIVTLKLKTIKQSSKKGVESLLQRLLVNYFESGTIEAK